MSQIVDIFGAISKRNVSIFQWLSVLKKRKKKLVRLFSLSLSRICFWLSLSLLVMRFRRRIMKPPVVYQIRRRLILESNARSILSTAGFINKEIGGIWGLTVSEFWFQIEEISKQEASSFFSRYDSRFIMCRFVYLICWI